MNTWQCPHPRAFLEKIWGALHEGDRHLVIQMPGWQIDAFLEEFNAIGLHNRESFIITDSNAYLEPEEYIKRSLKKEIELTPENYSHLELTVENIILRMPDDPDDNLLAKWLEFYDKLARSARDYQEAHQDGTRGRRFPLLWRTLTLMPAHFPSPTPETSLEIYLNDRIYQSDLEYAIESCCEDMGIRDLGSMLWLSSLCQGLALNDLNLCNHIFDNLPLSMDEIEDLLRDYPVIRLDTDMRNAVIALDDNGARHVCNRTILSCLRDYGLLEYDCHDMERLHPAALAQARRPASIEKMVNKGQIKIYFPVVQEVLNFIIGHLTRACGPDWHKHDPKNFPTVDREIGPLPAYMRQYLRAYCSAELIVLAEKWRDLRNRIAHGKMLDFVMAREAVKLYQKFDN